MKEFMPALTSLEQFEQLRNQDKVTVFTFSANWCPDCVFLKPFIKELIDKHSDYDFIYVDRDEYIDICRELSIMGIPSFVAFRKGEEINRFVSKLRKTKDEIDQFLGGLA